MTDLTQLSESLSNDINMRINQLESQINKRFTQIMTQINEKEAEMENMEMKLILENKHKVNLILIDFNKYVDYVVRNELSQVPRLIDEWKLKMDELLNQFQMELKEKQEIQMNLQQSKIEENANGYQLEIQNWIQMISKQFNAFTTKKLEYLETSMDQLLAIKTHQHQQSEIEWKASTKSVFLIQQQFDVLKATCISNSEKIDHNLVVLSKQEEENGIILNGLKRQLTQLIDKLNKQRQEKMNKQELLKSTQHDRDELAKTMNGKMLNVTSNHKNSLNKLHANYNELWQLKEQEMMQLVSEINDLSDYISNQHLQAVEINSNVLKSNELQLSKITQQALIYLQKDQMAVLNDVFSQLTNLVPLELSQVDKNESDAFELNLEYFLKSLQISKISQFDYLLQYLHDKPIDASYKSYLMHFKPQHSNVDQYWQKLIPKVKHAQIIQMVTNTQFMNYQSSQHMNKEIHQLQQDATYLKSILKQ
eukprot:NODE_516_length_6577_cov_0.589379.p1 type:complete len:479 gc:universal NODE_516_length_6577_cov_0.589379:5390-3954(-)